jgi:hypothetical protein
MGELLEQVHYRNAQFRISRKNKIMARLVNDKYLSALEELIRSDAALEDTLWLMLDKEARNIINESLAQSETARKIPLEQAFSD